MVKVTKIVLNEQTKTATVDLFADAKADMTGLSTDDIVGFPKGYTIDFGSSVFTSAGELAFMKSDGNWNWGE